MHIDRTRCREIEKWGREGREGEREGGGGRGEHRHHGGRAPLAVKEAVALATSFLMPFAPRPPSRLVTAPLRRVLWKEKRSTVAGGRSKCEYDTEYKRVSPSLPDRRLRQDHSTGSLRG